MTLVQKHPALAAISEATLNILAWVQWSLSFLCQARAATVRLAKASLCAKIRNENRSLPLNYTGTPQDASKAEAVGAFTSKQKPTARPNPCRNPTPSSRDSKYSSEGFLSGFLPPSCSKTFDLPRQRSPELRGLPEYACRVGYGK